MSLPTWFFPYPGVPAAGLFASTGGLGSPIIVDSTTDTPYYFKAGAGPTPFAGGSGSALPVGSFYFSDNATNPATTLGYGTWSLVSSGYLSLTP